MKPLTPACLALSPDGTPYSETFGDVYHTSAGGFGQARHVFLAGNGLPERWQGRETFAILETGFGLGLNFLATWREWRADPKASRTLRFISVEKHPFTREDLGVLHQRWPELMHLSGELLDAWPALTPGAHPLRLDDGRVTLTLLFGDVAGTLPGLQANVDAFYLDGFAPAKNPEMWSPEVFTQLARLGGAGATLATYAVAGRVRHALRDAGFAVEKRPGFGGKREMLAGELGRTDAVLS